MRQRRTLPLRQRRALPMRQRRALRMSRYGQLCVRLPVRIMWLPAVRVSVRPDDDDGHDHAFDDCNASASTCDRATDDDDGYADDGYNDDMDCA